MAIDTLILRIEGKTNSEAWVPVAMTRSATAADSSPDTLTELPVSYQFSSIYDRRSKKIQVMIGILTQAMEVMRTDGSQGFVRGCHYNFSAFKDIRAVEVPSSDFQRRLQRLEQKEPRSSLEEAMLEHGE